MKKKGGVRSFSDFLQKSGPEAQAKVKTYETIFTNEWNEFQLTLSALSSDLSENEKSAYLEIWQKEIMLSLSQIMIEDLQKYHYLSVEQATDIVREISATASQFELQKNS